MMKTFIGRMIGTRVPLGLVSLSAAACGIVVPSGNGEESQSSRRPVLDANNATNVPLALQSANGGFQLTEATSTEFTIQITGCASGYTTTVVSSSSDPVTSIPLYTGDGGCVAELEQFVLDGITYTKSGGGTLGSGSALFTDGTSNNLFVTVVSELGATIGPSSEVLYLVTESKAGADYAISGYSTSAPLSISAIEAPELEIPASGVSLASISASSGTGTFTVHLQCQNTLAPTSSSCQTGAGQDQLFSNMRVKLVKDTYGGILDYTTASTIMASSTTAVLDPGNLSTAEPITTAGFVLSLEGPGQLYFNKNMLLVVEYMDPQTSFKSYRYFNVDIGDPE